MGWVVNSTTRQLYPGKQPRYQFYRRLRRPRGRSGGVRKFSPSPGSHPWTFQPVANRCTDYTILATYLMQYTTKYIFDFHHSFLWYSYSSNGATIKHDRHGGNYVFCPKKSGHTLLKFLSFLMFSSVCMWTLVSRIEEITLSCLKEGAENSV
jgi:hypothetical protein